ALLANDIDPDRTLDITVVGGANSVGSLSLVTNPGSVMLADTAPSGGSFTYTASDGLLTGGATVNVSSQVAANTYSENFNDGSYTNDDGAWTDNWAETGDGGGAATGDIQITGGRLNFNSGAGTNDAVTRAINLDGATAATLTFIWTDVGIDAGETIAVEAFNATTNAWELLGTLAGSATADNVNQPFTANLSAAQMSASSAIRFRSVGGVTGAGENYFIDNVSVAFTRPGVVGGAGSEVLVGDDTGTQVKGGGGNDIILANAGDDTIVWNANASGATDGRDIIDGGADNDTFQLNGRTGTGETFRIYTRDAFLAINPAALLAAGTEIVITRDGTDAASIVAELDNIEEIGINALAVSANDGNGNANGGADAGDTVEVYGDFNTTSLNFSTITVGGTSGDDTVDISGLTSEHRIVFNTNGGNDQVIGNLRPQDVVNAMSANAAEADITPEPATAEVPAAVSDDYEGSPQGVDEQGDTFHFASIREARGAVITSFEPGDRIDLSEIDAARGVSGNQSFTLVSAELAERGELLVTHEICEGEEFTVVSGKTWGDDGADFKISIKGMHNLTASDFTL
ncbi:MAG: hypothetical protein JSR79_02105, partial [Proteobacteria bacterium]|nr:hypothetical protein [Pseudomonadota bacterium]